METDPNRTDPPPMPLAPPPAEALRPDAPPVPVRGDEGDRWREKAGRARGGKGQERERQAERLREAEREAKKARRKEKDEAEKAEKEAKSRRGRGVETLFRTSYMVNMDLTSLADAKANIMVSVNGLMLTILLGTLAPGLDTNPWLRIPTAVLLAFITGALIFGVLAARPRVESNQITLNDVRANRANLLFFGNFASMSRDEFVGGMRELMDQPDEVYRSMSMDLYGIGSVLKKKYHFLRISYTLFLTGILVGALLFIGVIAFATPRTTTPTIEGRLVEPPTQTAPTPAPLLSPTP